MEKLKINFNEIGEVLSSEELKEIASKVGNEEGSGSDFGCSGKTLGEACKGTLNGEVVTGSCAASVNGDLYCAIALGGQSLEEIENQDSNKS